MMYSEEKDRLKVSPGWISRVQPLDVVFNKPFKYIIWRLFELHIDENLVNYTKVKKTAPRRRVLITKSVATACSKCQKKNTW